MSGEGPGENPNSDSNSNSRIIHPPLEDIFDGDGSFPDSPFSFTYNGITHTMRYITVTSADNPRYFATDTAALISASSTSQEINDCINSLLYWGLDSVSNGVAWGTIAEICGISFSNINLSYSKSLSITAYANWTRVYTQIYNENTDIWLSYSSVDMVEIYQQLDGFYYDNTQHSIQKIEEETTTYRYSEHYSDYYWRKQHAARGWNYGSFYHEYVGDVEILYSTEPISLDNLPERIFYFPQYEAAFP